MSSQPRPPAYGQADLSNCDREPIHIPGAVQPHGVLLALKEPDLRILQVSENAAAVLGVEPAALLGSDLRDWLDPHALGVVTTHLGRRSFREINPLRAQVHGRLFDAILHRSGTVLVLELEPAELVSQGTFRDFNSDVSQAMARLQGADSLDELMQTAAEEVRRISGFDRVMVYRFAHDGHGQVVGEAREPSLEPFLGLHYPASDIPQQARRLYALNWLRLIANVKYQPARLLARESGPDATPLDLSHAVLRSVSPIHVEYLSNMGVAASMSVSLLKDDALWGLIACHHYAGTRFVPYQVRVSCEFLGQALSWMLAAKERAGEAEVRLRANDVRTAIVERLIGDLDIEAALTAGSPSALQLVDAGGVAVFHEGRLATAGQVPAPAALRALAPWLQSTMPGEVLATDALALAYPAAEAFQDVGSGLLAVGFPKAQGSFVLWFRPEAARTVQWGGNPHKTYEEGPLGPRLTPRGSFALWQETVRLRSLPWQSWERTAAAELRNTLVEVSLKKSNALDATREMLLGIVSHDLRQPLGAITLSAQMLRRGGLLPEVSLRATARIATSTDRMRRMVEQLLDYSRVRAGALPVEMTWVDLAALCRQLAEEALAARPGTPIQVEVPDACVAECDPDRIAQVLSNLLGNARHHGEPEKPVRLLLSDTGTEVRLEVHNEGTPIAADMIPRLFDPFLQGRDAHRSRKKSGGLGLGLHIAKQVVDAHRGSIEVLSGSGIGTAFVVRLPKKQS